VSRTWRCRVGWHHWIALPVGMMPWPPAELTAADYRNFRIFCTRCGDRLKDGPARRKVVSQQWGAL
jgi:hypothetical protein